MPLVAHPVVILPLQQAKNGLIASLAVPMPVLIAFTLPTQKLTSETSIPAPAETFLLLKLAQVTSTQFLKVLLNPTRGPAALAASTALYLAPLLPSIRIAVLSPTVHLWLPDKTIGENAVVLPVVQWKTTKPLLPNIAVPVTANESVPIFSLLVPISQKLPLEPNANPPLHLAAQGAAGQILLQDTLPA